MCGGKASRIDHEWSICDMLKYLRLCKILRAGLNYNPSNLNAVTSRVGSRVNYLVDACL